MSKRVKQQWRVKELPPKFGLHNCGKDILGSILRFVPEYDLVNKFTVCKEWQENHQ
jgi:hypothetical protein